MPRKPKARPPTPPEGDLREAVSLLTATLESTADGILVVGRSGAITTLNQRFLEMWRIPPAVAKARNDDQLLGFVLDQLQDPNAFLAKVMELYGRPEAESHDSIRFKDGRVFERFSIPQSRDRHGSGRPGLEFSGRLGCPPDQRRTPSQ